MRAYDYSNLLKMIFGFPGIYGGKWTKKAVRPLKGVYSSLSIWDTAKEHNRKKRRRRSNKMEPGEQRKNRQVS